jgi:5-enolpyruvylshikimate-3-phosphate synthase
MNSGEDQMSREPLPFPREIELPFDEGVFARTALAACLTDDETRIAGIPDTIIGRTVLDNLSGMGYEIERIDETQVNIHGRGYEKPESPSDVIDCAFDTDLAHLFAGFLAGWGIYGAIRSDNPHHSMKGLADAVKTLGGEILGRDDDCLAPWAVRAASLAAMEIRPANPHPSLRSALTIMFLLGQGTGSFPTDLPGNDGMERAITHYKGEIRRSEGRFHIKGGERVLAIRREMPRSFRLAVPTIIAASMLSAKPVRLPGILLNQSRASTLGILGHAGIDFSVDKMAEIDGEVAADIEANPSEPQGLELGGGTVRSVYEDIGPLIAMACLCNGLSEFSTVKLIPSEAEGLSKLTGEIASATGASFDAGGNSITIEGNPAGEPNEEATSQISNYPARTLVALYHKLPGALDKAKSTDILGKRLTQVILGDLLF